MTPRKQSASRPDTEPPPNQRSLQIGARTVTYSVRRSRRARRISLRISDRRGLELVLPERATLEDGIAFVKQNAGWIRKHSDVLVRTQQHATPPGRPPDTALYRGRSYPVECRSASRARVVLTGTHMRVLAPSHDAARDIMVRWYRNRARIAIPERVRELATDNATQKVRCISIRDQRTRWGSCSGKGTLSFNWRLMMMPPDVMDYVIVHELVHVAHPHHQTEFWDAVEQRMPNFETHKRWLKTCGEQLLKDWPPA